MLHLRTWRSPGLPSVAVAVLAAVALAAAPAAADTTASTDDSNISTPTGWWTYTNVTTAQVSSYLDANGARLTDIEPYDAATGTWTVVMVRNSGAYAVPGWWWYVGQTGAQVESLLSANGARLIHIQPYATAGGTRFAAVMVPNSGSLAREWYWGYGQSSAQIGDHLSSRSTRLTDLETYVEGGVKKYAWTSVRNAGGDSNGWHWWLNLSQSALSAELRNKNARLIDLERQADGSYNAVAVVNTGTDAAAWWWRPSSTSMTDLLNYAAQLGVRLLDVETYTVAGARRYAGVFIDNANAATRRIRGIWAPTMLDGSGNPTRGIFESYLKRVGSTVHVDLNASRRAETASSLKVLHLLYGMRRVQAGEDLGSSFTYYNYPSTAPWPGGVPSNACPHPVDEVAGNRMTNWDFERGMDEMMSVSDNRTTRGMVLRYGGFAPFNTLATAIGLTGTKLRHNIGCAYWDPQTGKFSASRRNDTTARDLATIWEGAYRGQTVSGTARTEFLESGNPGSGAGDALQALIDEEAADLGKPASTASAFGDLVRSWGKSGNYGTCLPAADGSCGKAVVIHSGAGIIRLPAKASGIVAYRNYVFGRLVSDAPVSCSGCPTAGQYKAVYSEAAVELYREQVRSALSTW